MTALTTDRRTPERSGDRRQHPVKAGATFYAGALVALGADGFAVPMTAATGLIALGRCETRADNVAGADGEIAVTVGAGIYRFSNSAGGDEITTAHIGQPCYGVDDQTVALTDGTGTRSVAGTVFDVDAQGVWVDFR
ncbi:hypothetical protein J7481_06610 [Labrenzia sp. R4_2]|uniref:hypothetical protein n=1 Tax=Labrenzia sp. R4_2 TaxID=2821107 RepID=UPI001ADC7DFD|nr:hypothetical protein [Labrenzia sp. R4_2]MBO9419160.1 hypothetical protein [Labrenzia sp. R4_2]